jgi:HSP20 family protein
MPTTVDAEKIQASFKDGVLELRLPKSEAAKPKQIPIADKQGTPASETVGATSGR